MPDDIYAGMRRALTLAMWTGQSVNVGLNRGGQGVKIEGIIQGVYNSGFTMLLDAEDGGDPTLDLVCVAEAEYVEYS